MEVLVLLVSVHHWAELEVLLVLEVLVLILLESQRAELEVLVLVLVRAESVNCCPAQVSDFRSDSVQH